ncbi:MAG: hypothetical protein KAG53_04700 [Endozoicomonadaceae bacterium]|nr:hypothetical protein [Endozoicomonadaceae bacterium]
MKEVTFSGRAAFSYVWNKYEEISGLRRICFAVYAGIIGCTFGYKVNNSGVSDCLKTCARSNKHENAYFNEEIDKKINDRNVHGKLDNNVQETSEHTVKVKDYNSRYETHSHEGKSFWMDDIKCEKYITSDVKGMDGEKTVKIETANRDSNVLIRYDYVKTDSNIIASRSLSTALDLSIENYKEPSKLYEKICEKVNEKYDVTKDFENLVNPKNIPEFVFLEGDAKKQHEHVKKVIGQRDVVVFNTSQLNYQEQVSKNHDIKGDISLSYWDTAFGSATVKTEKGGFEFLVHTLLESNKSEFSGAFCDFFRTTQTDNKLHSDGGYYNSDLDENEWYKLTEKLINSETRTEGFCWGTAIKGKDEKIKFSGKTIYQTGAINASGDNGCGLYRDLHEKAGPPFSFQFFMFFYQIRNALMHETNRKDSIVVHTTSLGEGVFGNKKNVSMIALQAAILSIPSENRDKVKGVFFGSYGNTDVFDEFGKKTSVFLLQKVKD